MKSTYSMLVQSRFFNPAFNSAIFDGPVRIYFSQFYESLALKLYFSIQQQLPELLSKAKTMHREIDRNVLVMLYPNQNAFEMSFDGQDAFLICEHLEADHVVGINGAFDDDKIPEVVRAVSNAIVDSISKWELKPSLEANMV